MKLIVGLGNPGKQYEHNRHNIGRITLDAWIQQENFSGNFSYQNNFSAEIMQTQQNDQKIILAKPMLFMNKSGTSIQQISHFYKITPKNILILHDEIDLAFGTIKLKSGGGHAGHNGLRDIIEKIGNNFSRIRIGVGHPGEKSEVANYVLSDFSTSEKQKLEEIYGQVTPIIQGRIQKN